MSSISEPKEFKPNDATAAYDYGFTAFDLRLANATDHAYDADTVAGTAIMCSSATSVTTSKAVASGSGTDTSTSTVTTLTGLNRFKNPVITVTLTAEDSATYDIQIAVLHYIYDDLPLDVNIYDMGLNRGKYIYDNHERWRYEISYTLATQLSTSNTEFNITGFQPTEIHKSVKVYASDLCGIPGDGRIVLEASQRTVGNSLMFVGGETIASIVGSLNALVDKFNMEPSVICELGDLIGEISDLPTDYNLTISSFTELSAFKHVKETIFYSGGTNGWNQTDSQHDLVQAPIECISKINAINQSNFIRFPIGVAPLEFVARELNLPYSNIFATTSGGYGVVQIVGAVESQVQTDFDLVNFGYNFTDLRQVFETVLNKSDIIAAYILDNLNLPAIYLPYLIQLTRAKSFGIIAADNATYYHNLFLSGVLDANYASGLAQACSVIEEDFSISGIVSGFAEAQAIFGSGGKVYTTTGGVHISRIGAASGSVQSILSCANKWQERIYLTQCLKSYLDLLGMVEILSGSCQIVNPAKFDAPLGADMTLRTPSGLVRGVITSRSLFGDVNTGDVSCSVNYVNMGS